MSTHDDLERILAEGTWRRLGPLLSLAVESGTGKDVRRWYRARRAYWSTKHVWISSADPEVDGRACLRVLAVGLAQPEQAANWVGKLSFGWLECPADSLMVELAVGRGRDWCTTFLETASSLKFSKDDETNIGWIARLATPLISAGLAEVPGGAAYGLSWASHYASGGARARWAAYRENRATLDPGTQPEKHRDLTINGGKANTEGVLVDLLRAGPAVAEGLAAALAHPRALGMFEYYAAPGWELGPAVAQLVHEGSLDRSRVLDDVLGALTRQDPPGTQRSLATLLSSLSLSGADLKGRMPLVQGLLATNRGSVTAALLPAAIAAAGPTDVDELCATVFARPEKAQRALLLKALQSPDAVSRWGCEPVIAGLQRAADVPDWALAARASKALADLGSAPRVVTEPSVSDLWALPDPAPATGPVRAVEPTEPSMTAALSQLVARPTATDGAMLWDAVVRWVAVAPHEARAWARGQHDGLGDMVRPPALRALLNHGEASLARHVTLCERVVELHVDGMRRTGAAWRVTSLSISQAIHAVHSSEVTLRLGTIPYLLSTPTRADGVLSFDALRDRVADYGNTAVGAADLFVALLRLEPVAPERRRELDGMSLDVWSPSSGRLGFRGTARRGYDAVPVIQTWIAGGGLPRLSARHEGGTVTIEPATLPVSIETFLGMPPALVAGHRDGVHDEYFDYSITAEADIGIVPSWVDILAAKTQRQFDQTSRFPPRFLPEMVRTPSPGLAVLHDLAATLCHADEEHRLVAVDSALSLMGRGLWDASAYTECCLHMLDDGKLRLGRLGHSWEQLILAGGLQPLWPSAEAVLSAAAGFERKPAGLSDLFAVLRRYVSAVPEPTVPQTVLELADASGSSKAKAEAKAYVAAALKEAMP